MSSMIDKLDPIAENLTGQNMDEMDGDMSGTYWARDIFVSSDSIREALIHAYHAGYQACKDGDES